MKNKKSNKLIYETSPYLLQHAYNPVNWYPWGEEALTKAAEEQKIILVSIGYAACHWCHVMERESFEDEATAAIMNEHFINIKIDREERPDLDHIYMDAVQAMTGSGGWPLNVFLTPETKPFYGGTYFPPVKAYNRNSWVEVLEGLQLAWQNRRGEILAQAEKLTQHLQQSTNAFTNSSGRETFNIGLETVQPVIPICKKMNEQLLQNADKTWGGFGQAPKFPQTGVIRFLLQHFYFTKNQASLQQAILSIDKMLEGGIYDQIGGGLARYSTDKYWLAPHFEKMLYDNALFLDTLTEAWQLTGETRFQVAIEEIMQFLEEEMLHAEGGFYSALDADSEGVEGKYYVWTKDEIDALLGKDAPLFCTYYQVSSAGNWEHTNILHRRQSMAEVAAHFNLELKQANSILAAAKSKLKLSRGNRVKPGLDDKILLGWNALLLHSLANLAGKVPGEKWLEKAEKNYLFLKQAFCLEATNQQWLHTWKNNQAKYPAFLDDLAYLIRALLALHTVTQKEIYLQDAQAICIKVCENFSDEANLFFYFTAKQQNDIIVRKKELYDGATPSANAIMAENLYKLGSLFDDIGWRKRSLDMLNAMQGAIEKYTGSFSTWACFFQQISFGIPEISILGEDGIKTAADMRKKYYFPNKVMQVATLPQINYPLLKNKAVQSKSTIYVCKNTHCAPPVHSLLEFERLIAIKENLHE
jgi:uncharacterized protein YyaL (SSP411 family)